MASKPKIKTVRSSRPVLPPKPDRAKVRRCVTGKRQFMTEHDAQQALTEAKLQRFIYNKQRRRETRMYQCDKCYLWHITSMPLPPDDVKEII